MQEQLLQTRYFSLSRIPNKYSTSKLQNHQDIEPWSHHLNHLPISFFQEKVNHPTPLTKSNHPTPLTKKPKTNTDQKVSQAESSPIKRAESLKIIKQLPVVSIGSSNPEEIKDSSTPEPIRSKQMIFDRLLRSVKHLPELKVSKMLDIQRKIFLLHCQGRPSKIKFPLIRLLQKKKSKDKLKNGVNKGSLKPI